MKQQSCASAAYYFIEVLGQFRRPWNKVDSFIIVFPFTVFKYGINSIDCLNRVHENIPVVFIWLC